METYARTVDIRNQVDPNAKSYLIPEEWKADIDQRMVVDYMAANRYFAENNPDLQQEIERILEQSPSDYYESLVQTWRSHHEFFETYLEPIVVSLRDYEADELSPSIIDLITEAYCTSVEVDNVTLAHSAAIKKFVEKHGRALAEKYGEDFDDFVAQYLSTSTYFSYYTAKNLVVSLDDNASAEDMRMLAQEFHGNDPVIMGHRLNDLQKRYRHTIPARIRSAYQQEDHEPTKPGHISDEDWIQIIALRNCVRFDNIEEYMIATNLEGASGYVLRKLIAAYLVGTGIIDSRDGIYDYDDSEIIKGLDTLKKRNESFSFRIKPKVQYGITCSAACATMVEARLREATPNDTVERVYASASNSAFIPGQHYSHLAAEMISRGIDVTLVHSLQDKFKVGSLGQELFKQLRAEYDTGLERFAELGGEEESGVDMSASLLRSILMEGKPIILAGQSIAGDYYHSVLLMGLSDDGYQVVDPLIGRPAIWTEQQVMQFSDTDIGRWMIIVNGGLGRKSITRFFTNQLRLRESEGTM